jgi:protein SCO1/2
MQRRMFVAAGSALAGAAAGAGLAGRRATAEAASRIPNVEVLTHDGHKFRFYDDLVKGRVVTLNFMFTSCGDTCPLVTANLRTLQDLLGERVGRDIFMYSLTLRPEEDTPEVLRDYAAMYEVRPGWRFLTGAPDDIERLRRRLGFASADPELDRIADEHTGILRYGNEALDRWAGCPALSRPEWIVKAITTSLAA